MIILTEEELKEAVEAGYFYGQTRLINQPHRLLVWEMENNDRTCPICYKPGPVNCVMCKIKEMNDKAGRDQCLLEKKTKI